MGDEGYRLETLLELRRREEEACVAGAAEAARASQTARAAEHAARAAESAASARRAEAAHAAFERAAAGGASAGDMYPTLPLTR
jgi:hypothetical protein